MRVSDYKSRVWERGQGWNKFRNFKYIFIVFIVIRLNKIMKMSVNRKKIEEDQEMSSQLLQS